MAGRLTALGAGFVACSLVIAGLVGTPGASASPGLARWLPPTPATWPLVVDEQTSAKQTLTRGVQQWSDHLDTAGGAQRAQVMDVDLTDPNLRLGVVESHDHLTDTADEVPTSMADRTGAIAGVNSDFFEIYGSGRPEGMVVIDGQLVKSPNASRPWNLMVRDNGSIGIGPATYAGTVTAGAASHPITSVNTVNDLSTTGALVRVTSYLGTPSPIPSSTVVSGKREGAALVITSITPKVTDLAQLPAGTEELVGTGDAGTWLTANAHLGDRLAIAEKVGPDNDLRQAVSGGAILVKDGERAVPLQGPGENNINNPVTAVGVTKDGKKAIFAAFDGHQAEGVAQGLTEPQLAGWLIQHGAYNAILFDSGGSTQMVGRLPGQTTTSVLNVPSDGHERPVANGLFLYSTSKQPGPATHTPWSMAANR
ncbi:phosphodiester glycosidase family protein [Fodinicola feengrottensis]|uniref:phosphodiester glycosidase family protein n=1 Tax=Fodinicola feengrottensis TaxID=435914 RepID=UPI0024413260|nr:phosphodiester glycosidase family protein [Fodinicola feengrottensis]